MTFTPASRNSSGVFSAIWIERPGYNYSIYELKIPKDWYGKSLAQVDIRKKYNINILTFKRGDNVFLPTADTVVLEGDIAFVIGEVKDINKCFRI